MTKKVSSVEVADQCSDSVKAPEEVSLDDIIVDQKYQARVHGLDEETVEEYKAIYAESPEQMPPITLVRINGKLYLVAGFQRYEAATRALCESIMAIVIDGDEKTAMQEALGSNKHGLKLSSGDKKKAIKMAVETFRDYSNTMIAELIGCSESYVRKVMDGEESQVRTGANLSDTVVGKDGKRQVRHKKAGKAVVKPTTTPDESVTPEPAVSEVTEPTEPTNPPKGKTILPEESPAPTATPNVDLKKNFPLLIKALGTDGEDHGSLYQSFVNVMLTDGFTDNKSRLAFVNWLRTRIATYPAQSK